MGGDIKYTCSNGSWSRSGNGRCVEGCNDMSSIYDINGNKISNQLYGTSFANNGNNNEIHTYQICYKNNNTSTAYNLNTNKTGIGNMNPEEYIRCAPHLDNLRGYYTQTGRKLICKNNGNFSYWQYQYASCSLNELVNISGLNIKLAYGGFGSSYAKDIGTIMNSGARQERFPAYYNLGYQAEWSKLYITPNNSTIGATQSSISITCGENGKWVNDGYLLVNTAKNINLSSFYAGNMTNFKAKAYGANGVNSSVGVGGKGALVQGIYNGNITQFNVGIHTGGTGGIGAKDNGSSGGSGISLKINGNTLILVAGGGGGSGAFTLSGGSSGNNGEVGTRCNGDSKSNGKSGYAGSNGNGGIAADGCSTGYPGGTGSNFILNSSGYATGGYGGAGNQSSSRQNWGGGGGGGGYGGGSAGEGGGGGQSGGGGGGGGNYAINGFLINANGSAETSPKIMICWGNNTNCN